LIVLRPKKKKGQIKKGIEEVKEIENLKHERRVQRFTQPNYKLFSSPKLHLR
jgi:hypothetical protein